MNNFHLSQERLPISNLMLIKYIDQTHVKVSFEDKYHASYIGEFKYYLSNKGVYILINKKRVYIGRVGQEENKNE